MQFRRNCLSDIVATSGDNGVEVTPVPIPNTKVKLYCADGTYRVTCWESRSLPVLSLLEALAFRGSSMVEHSAVNR